jgi:pantetheine-phosphate adenylyltransferase
MPRTTGISTAVFPGSFDPVTNGHTDIIHRALDMFDQIVVAIAPNPAKNTLFTPEERVALIREEFVASADRVRVESFPGLLVDFVRGCGARVIIRGLRAVSDYEYEAQMALMNRRLAPDIETYFLMGSEMVSYISSSVVKQVASFGGDVSTFVPANVNRALVAKYCRVAP